MKKQKPTILVTIPPYAYLTERIVKDLMHVKSLIPPGMNIHIYEPSPKLVQEIGLANVWFQIEEPFEKKITKALLERNPDIKLVDLQEGVQFLSDDDAIELSPCVNSHQGNSRDLHTWLSPKIAQKQAKIIADTLISLYPEKKEFFEQNFKKLSLDLKFLDENIAKELAPFVDQAILVSHSAFGYFCKEYRLKQISIECEGKEPRPKDLERILKQANSYKIRCVFLQQGFDNRGAMLIGEKLQLPIFQIDPYDKNYIKNMNQIMRYIIE